MSPALLADEGTVQGLSATLPDGYRAITIHVDRYSGLDGFLFPEAHVDVIAALGSGNDTAARTVAQNVRVLAVAGRLRGESLERTGEEQAAMGSEHNVTLMVTPEQAAAIQLACADGMPRLMLRPGSDSELHPFLGMTLAELRGDELGDPFQNSPWDAEPVNTGPVTPVDPPATQPVEPVGPAQPPKVLPRMHVIEVIRAGVITRTALPAGGAGEQRAQPERAIANSDTGPAAD
jgi:Flp pilus assembly protein CpaB